MYTVENYKTKKALKEAVGLGKEVTLYQPNNIFGIPDPVKGIFAVEGPHYPEAHKWWAEVRVENGRVVSVK